MPPKEKVSLLCAIFGIKQGEARKHVYEKFSKEWSTYHDIEYDSPIQSLIYNLYIHL